MMMHENHPFQNISKKRLQQQHGYNYLCHKLIQLLVMVGSSASLVFVVMTLLLLYPMTATAIHSCSSSSSLEQMLHAGSSSRDGRGGVVPVSICPDHSKCCEIPNKLPSLSSSSFGCLPDNPHIEGPGTCCNDLTKYGTTACPGYYTCATTNSTSTTNSSNSSSPFICILNDSLANVMDIKPRYNLIPSPKEALGRIYGFPIQSNDKMGLGPVVAYYSNMGPILTSSKRRRGGMTSMDSNVNIEAAIVVVHGSGRNADEYLYSMMVASQMQSRYSYENVLVIAPMFLAPEDGVYAVPVIMEEEDWMGMMREPMVWNETFPIAHTWRYGANALAPNDKYSSYDVMDAIVEKLLLMVGGEDLKRIIVAGHSAGGQFTQRWALTSNSPAWPEGDDQDGVRPWSMQNGNVSTKRRRGTEWNSRLFNHSTFDLRVVVANPRSFAYLDERRWVNSTHFAIPSRDKIESCPTYNSWEWGLQPGGLEAPYKDRALELFDGDVVRLAERYSKRNVVYLAGFDDTEHMRGSCEDDGFQGTTRLERSSFFYKSLGIYFDKTVHSRVVIDCVGHDHSLMFQSEEARNVMFGE